MAQTYPVVFQAREDYPGNPGWWRYSRPIARRASVAQLDRWFASEEYRYTAWHSMAAARRDAGRQQAEWRASYA